MRAELLGELQGIRVAIHHDDVGRGERSQALDADVAEPACANHRAGRTGIQQGDRLAYGVVCRDARVGQCCDVLRLAWQGRA